MWISDAKLNYFIVQLGFVIVISHLKSSRAFKIQAEADVVISKDRFSSSSKIESMWPTKYWNFDGSRILILALSGA